MNHYVKIGAAVAGGIISVKFFEAGLRAVAKGLNSVAEKLGNETKAEDAPAAEAPKPEKPGKPGGKKDGKTDKKDDKPGEGASEEK